MYVSRIFGLCLSVALIFHPCAAFLPNVLVSFLKPGDYTHQDITEIGILLAVAEYFETKPAPGRLATPAGGSLTGLGNGITARKLYDNYFGTAVSEAKLQDAIDDVVNYNSIVERDHFTEAMWHLNAEQIQQANQKMQSLRDTVIQILSNSSTPNYNNARQVMGQYLHLIQDFYSNTNWIELGKSTIYQDLGISGKSLMAVASASDETCQSCGTHAKVPMPCFISSPLIVSNKLTSGYRSGQDITKPQADPKTQSNGKCSHGGINDKTATTIAAVGGINKETSDGHYSDLFLSHTKAADAAIEHTKFFFNDATYGLRHLIGDDKFVNLLRLQTGNSLIFVIDTSGTAERDAIDQMIQSIVHNSSFTGQVPYDYLMVTVDRTTHKSSVQTTKDSNQISTWLQGLSLPSSPVCPGTMVQATEAAVAAAGYMSTIYVFTDTPPKDATSLNYIESLTTDKHLTLTFIVTGQCSRRRRRRNSAYLTEWKLHEGVLTRTRNTFPLKRSFPVSSSVQQKSRVERATQEDSEPFTARFLEYSAAGNSKFEINGSPHAAKEITILIRMNSQYKVASLDSILLVDEDDAQLASTDVKRSDSKTQILFQGDIVIPYQSFYIQVLGTDLNNNRVVLTSKKQIFPEFD